ncbi:HD domain-containing protein [Dethiosulfatarculus sandiegensis]|uniref:Phosphohydrolase n=1 Tax=Dethiosulfatarculus sandiegensis TaxID=1429043 RepID=A0A0D2GBD4_9BACT|nr:HD domain-containing protein [Dethiosulfatarculus sandiegensis]KIX12187.1 phosphohydrolase [Dethiosulfatarculus sandiegensis]
MGNTMCPGQDTSFWRPDDIFEVPCGNCGHEVEFFKDDATRRCKSCGTLVKNPKLNLGCAQWCEHAKDCLGYDPKEKLAQAESGDTSLTDKLIEAVKAVFGNDQKEIDHSLKVLDYARELIKKEPADPQVVMAAAILHDIGKPLAQVKHGSAAGAFHEMEGPLVAKEILQDLGLKAEVIDHICRIIANHHTAKGIDTPEFRLVWDADWLANIPRDFSELTPEKMEKLITKVFKTKTASKKAERLFL